MMKKLLTGLMTIAISLSAMAEVPSLINYQGRLKEKNGTNVNGSKNFTVRIFDAKEGGQQIYEKNIGAVTINEGAYSFGFGEAGESILDFGESLFVEEDGKQIFDFTLSRTPVAESLSIQSGVFPPHPSTGPEEPEFTWSEKTGSSDSDNLLVQYDKNNKSAKIIFLNSSPEKDSALRFNYRVEESGVMEALASSQSNWLEITVDGETLSPRERLVSVPFAMHAKSSEMSTMILYSFSGFDERRTLTHQNLFVWEKRIFVPKGVSELEVGIQIATRGGQGPTTPILRAELLFEGGSPASMTSGIVSGYAASQAGLNFTIKEIYLTESKFYSFFIKAQNADFFGNHHRFSIPMLYVIGR